MSLVLTGTNHKHCPIAIREKLSFTQRGLKEALLNLRGVIGARGVVILSTCNRVELYTDLEAEEGAGILKKFLADYRHLDLAKIEPYLYVYTAKAAILHLFAVASGLDSQIIGESQILEQVRFAYAQARAAEATSEYLEAVFNNALRASLRVRQQTGISEGSVSIASLVWELIKTKYSSIKDKKILIIGVGKITELVTRYLKGQYAQMIFIANRTFEKAARLAEGIGAKALRLEALKEELPEADIVISATASPHLILKKEDFLNIKKKMLVIDLAVPRDVEAEVRNIEGVSLFSLDGLDFIIEKNLRVRTQNIPAALEILKEEVENLCSTKLSELEREGVLLP